jgi:hypothetical protein
MADHLAKKEERKKHVLSIMANQLLWPVADGK